MKVQFVVPGEPKTKERPGFGRGRAYTRKKTSDSEKIICAEYISQCHGYMFPDKAALTLAITAHFSIAGRHSKANKRLMILGQMLPTKRPDLDNIIKVVMDALNKKAYNDDSQITAIYARKLYSDTPRVEICIESNMGGQ